MYFIDIQSFILLITYSISTLNSHYYAITKIPYLCGQPRLMKNNNNTPEKPAIESMFDSIAWRYDFLNHFLSFGIDRSWRKKAVSMLSGMYEDPEILDIATGTGDMAIEAMDLNPRMVTGIDISEKMIELAGRKIQRKSLEDKNKV